MSTEKFRFSGHHTRPAVTEVDETVFVAYEDGLQIYLVKSPTWTRSALAPGHSPSFTYVPGRLYLFTIDDDVLYYQVSLDFGVTFSSPESITTEAIACDSFVLPSGYVGVVVARAADVYLFSEEDTFASGMLIVSIEASEVGGAGYDGSEGDSIFIGYVADAILYTLYGSDIGSMSTPESHGSAQDVDAVFLSTGHLVVVVDRGWHLWGLLSTDLGASLSSEWEVQCFTSEGAAFPKLLFTESGDLYLFASVPIVSVSNTYARIRGAFLDLFAYISEVLPTSTLL